MPDDETVCGETSADIWRQQVKILERRVKELAAESELRGRQLEVEARAYKMLSDRLVEVETGRALAEAELAALNAEECEECESPLGDLMTAAEPSVATWFCLRCWNAAIGKATAESAEWKRRYLLVADAVARESTSAEDLARQARATRAALAEKTAECERLKTLREEAFQNAGTWAAEKGEAQRALAESRAREAKLRELCKLAAAQFALPVEHGAGAPLEVSRSLLAEIRAALALKADNAALREVCERVAREAFTFHPANSTPPLDTDIKTIVARVLGAAK